MNKEEIKNEFITCIEGSHTLNLAISVLEDREELKGRINKASDLLQLLHYQFPDYDDMHKRIEEIEKTLKEDNKEISNDNN